MTDVSDLLAAADELTDPRRHVEVITAWKWDSNRNKKKIASVRRITTLPSLLDQLAEAVVPGETWIENDSSRPGYASRPPARIDAIDRLLAIQAGSARWVVSLGLTVRETVHGNVRALVGASGTLDSDTLDALIYEVTTWRTWAATVTGWERAPWRPRVACPICDTLGSLRIRLEAKSACCMDCGEAWGPEAIGLLGECIKAAGELTEASA